MWTKWHWNGVSSEHFGFSLPVVNQLVFHIHPSTMRGMNTGLIRDRTPPQTPSHPTIKRRIGYERVCSLVSRRSFYSVSVDNIFVSKCETLSGLDFRGSVHHSTTHKENPTTCNNVSEFYYSIFK